MRTRLLGISHVAAALALSATVAACSSSSHSSSSPTTASSSAGTSSGGTSSGGTSSGGGSTPSGPSGSPIKVGEICSCSGTAGFSSETTPQPDAVKTWADSVNAAGGIAGHPVRIMSMDDGTNPGKSLTDAQTLISDHVVAIIDDTTLVDSWASQVQAAKIPVVGTDSINSPFTTNPDFYAEGQTNDTTLQAVVAVAKASGATKIANLYCAEAPVCAQSAPYMRAAGKAAGIPDVYDASIAATAPNFTAQCLAAKQKGVNAVFIGDAAGVVENVAASCIGQGYKPAYIIEGAGWEDIEKSKPGLSTSTWLQYPDIPFWDTSVPAVQTFDQALNKYYPGLLNNTSLWNQDAFMSYISGKLIQEGITKGGLTASATPSAAEVISGLDTLNGDTLDGLAPPLTFKAGQPNPQPCYFTATVKNGQETLANNGKPTCLPLPTK